MCVCACVVGAEVVLGGCGQWMVSTGTQTGEETSQVQISVPLQQVLHTFLSLCVYMQASSVCELWMCNDHSFCSE